MRRLLACGRGVVVTGPGGIGKTRLLQALEEADAPPVEGVTATAATTSIPLGALVRFLPPRAATAGGAAALAAVRTALVEAGDRGAVLAVDDADRLDTMSAAVLADVVRVGVRVVLCSRTAAAVPAPLLALLDEGALLELALEPLDDADAIRLVRAVAGASVSSRSLRWAVELGEGNPLLLTELARLAPRADVEPMPLTERLRRVVCERLAVLSRPVHEVVDLLAYDAPLPLRTLVAAASDPAVDEAERAGIVTTGSGPEHLVTLTHPLVGEVVADKLTAVHRSTLAWKLVAAVGDAVDGVPDGAVRHARWQIDAGRVTAPEVLRDASRELLARWDPAAAAHLATVARRQLPGDPALALVLAGVAVIEGRHDDAERWYGFVDGHPAASAVQRMQALLGRAEAAFFVLGDEAGARAVLEGADVDVPETVQPAAALSALIALCAGRYPEAQAAAAQVTVDAPADLRLTAAAVTHVAVGSAGRLEDAWRLTEEVMPLLDDPEVSPEHHFRFTAGRQYLRLQLGAIEEMRREGRAASAAERLRPVASDFGLAYGELVAGRGDRAREQLEHARARLEQTDPYGHRPFVAYIAAELAALQGRRQAALRAASAAADTHRPHLGWWAWAVPAAAGWADAADGRRGRARTRLRDAAAIAAGNDDLVHRCCCLLAALRLGALDVAAELRDAAAGIDGRMWPAVALAARGLADPSDEDECLERGCETLADVGATLWAVALLTRGALVDRAARRSDRAARRHAAAERHAQQLVEITPPALLHLREGPQARLTPRQRQIAMLAADGLTSRQIAQELVLSVRTVENHLARAYETLGVSSRQNLAKGLGIVAHRT